MNRYSIPSNIQVLKLINPRPLFPTFNNVEIKSDLSAEELLSRELVLIKVACQPSQRAELISLAEIAKAKIADITVNTMTLELSDSVPRIKNFEELLRPYGLRKRCVQAR